VKTKSDFCYFNKYSYTVLADFAVEHVQILRG